MGVSWGIGRGTGGGQEKELLLVCKMNKHFQIKKRMCKKENKLESIRKSYSELICLLIFNL